MNYDAAPPCPSRLHRECGCRWPLGTCRWGDRGSTDPPGRDWIAALYPPDDRGVRSCPWLHWTDRGGFFATILAARGGDDGVGGLSRRRVILAGALGGIAVQLLLQYVVLPPFLTTIPEPHPIGRLISWSFFGGLGALTGLAILGTAKRAALAAGEDDPNRLAP